MDDVLSTVYLDEMEFIQCQEKCAKCGAPKHYKKGQDVVFCWECIVNKENARRGSELLARIKRDVAAADGPEEDRGRNMYGIPL